MIELSTQYQDSAQLLSVRIGELRGQLHTVKSNRQRFLLEERIHTLSTMQREARDLAVFTLRYYDRGYHKNGKYTI